MTGSGRRRRTALGDERPILKLKLTGKTGGKQATSTLFAGRSLRSPNPILNQMVALHGRCAKTLILPEWTSHPADAGLHL